jgi:hypothetical protein
VIGDGEGISGTRCQTWQQSIGLALLGILLTAVTILDGAGISLCWSVHPLLAVSGGTPIILGTSWLMLRVCVRRGPPVTGQTMFRSDRPLPVTANRPAFRAATSMTGRRSR